MNTFFCFIIFINIYNFNIMNNISDAKEDIYLTTCNASIQTEDNMIYDYTNSNYDSPKKKQIILPFITNQLIKEKIIHNYKKSLSSEEFEDIRPQIAYVNSNIVSDNYLEYNETLKEKIPIKEKLLKNRKYTQLEKNLVSDLMKNEMKHRSPGQGMFVKIQKYNQLIRRKPINFNKINFTERYFKKITDLKKNNIILKNKKINNFVKNDEIPIFLKDKILSTNYTIDNENTMRNEKKPEKKFIFNSLNYFNDRNKSLTNRIRNQKIVIINNNNNNIKYKF